MRGMRSIQRRAIMRRYSGYLKRLKHALWHRARGTKDKKMKDDYDLLHDIAQDAENEVDEIIRDMESWAIRNPAIPGDMMGRPDDDFEPPDEKEEKPEPPPKDEDEKGKD